MHTEATPWTRRLVILRSSTSSLRVHSHGITSPAMIVVAVVFIIICSVSNAPTAPSPVLTPTICRVYTYRLPTLALPASNHSDYRLVSAWNSIVRSAQSCLDRGFDSRRLNVGSGGLPKGTPVFNVGQWELGCVVGRQLQTRLWHVTDDPQAADLLFVPWFREETYHRPRMDREAIAFFAKTLTHSLHGWAQQNGSNHLFLLDFQTKAGSSTLPMSSTMMHNL